MHSKYRYTQRKINKIIVIVLDMDLEFCMEENKETYEKE
jgi:hypothetical protein